MFLITDPPIEVGPERVSTVSRAVQDRADEMYEVLMYLPTESFEILHKFAFL